MTTSDFLIELFCWVDDRLGPVPKHAQAKLWPSEVVTIGLLFVLKGGAFRTFYRWLERDYAPLFGGHLPERTRLLRLLRVHQHLTDRFLAEPTLFTVVDSYGIELLHPWRYRRSRAQLGRKGWSNHRWIVGIKLCWLLNAHGQVVAWDWKTANTHDQHFLPLVRRLEGQTITLAHSGFVDTKGQPTNLKVCPRGSWNERMLVETVFSLVHRVCRLKYLWHRAAAYLEMHLAYCAALVNVLTALDGGRHDYPHLAQFAL